MKSSFLKACKYLCALVALLALTILVLSLLPLAAPLTQKSADPITIITRGNIVDARTNSVLENQSIQIERGRITAISSSSNFVPPVDALVIDAKGKYIIPGLWDMHNHFSFQTAPQMSMPLYVAAGVLNVREMQSIVKINDERRRWRRQIEQGKLLGPRIVAFADEMVGGNYDDQDVQALVKRSASNPDTFIKIYSGILPERYFKLAKLAKDQGVTFAGHYPNAIDAVEAARAGQRSFEHALLFLTQSYSGSQALREKYYRYYAEEFDFERTMEDRQKMLEEFDMARFEQLTTAMIENDTYFCPTHITRLFEAMAHEETYRNDPRRKYMPLLVDLVWQSDANSEAQWQGKEGQQYLQDVYHRGLELTGLAHRAGVKILAGGDTLDSYSFPGFSIHDELAQLVAAGLTPAEALVTATWNPASYFSATADHGSVEVGKVADLVMLAGNPLIDIEQVREIDRVIYNGAVYSQVELADFQDYVEHNNSGINGLVMSLKLFWRLFKDNRN